jgi:hypothetical protein
MVPPWAPSFKRPPTAAANTAGQSPSVRRELGRLVTESGNLIDVPIEKGS